MSALIYTPEIIAWVQKHYNIDIPGPRIAEKLGVSYKSLNVKVHKLRKKGYHFAEKQYNKPAEIGEIRKQSHGKRIHNMQKTADGWKYVKCPDNEKKHRTPKEPKPVKDIGKIVRYKSGSYEGKSTHIKTIKGYVRIPNEYRKSKQSSLHKQPEPVEMPRARSMRKAPEKPKEIKRTSLTDSEKLAAGYEWVWINSKTKVLRHPSKINQP